MRHCGYEQRGCDVAAIPVPVTDMLMPADSVQEPVRSRVVLSRQHWRYVRCMARPSGLALTLKILLAPYPRLEADIRLADVVQRGENAEARRSCLVDVIHFCRVSETPAYGRLKQESLEARADISEVVLQQVNAARVLSVRLCPMVPGVMRRHRFLIGESLRLG